MKSQKQMQAMKPVFEYFDANNNKVVHLKNLGYSSVELPDICCRSNIFTASPKDRKLHNIFHHSTLGKVTVDTYCYVPRYLSHIVPPYFR